MALPPPTKALASGMETVSGWVKVSRPWVSGLKWINSAQVECDIPRLLGQPRANINPPPPSIYRPFVIIVVYCTYF